MRRILYGHWFCGARRFDLISPRKPIGVVRNFCVTLDTPYQNICWYIMDKIFSKSFGWLSSICKTKLMIHIAMNTLLIDYSVTELLWPKVVCPKLRMFVLKFWFNHDLSQWAFGNIWHLTIVVMIEQIVGHQGGGFQQQSEVCCACVKYEIFK